MNAALERTILAAHPRLYRNLRPRFDDGQHFECGDGWGLILEELSTGLDPYAATDGVMITQVKQKLGSLTVYVELDGHDWSERAELSEYIDRWKNLASEKSNCTCEVCGAPGKMRGRPFRFMQALCEACWVVHRHE